MEKVIKLVTYGHDLGEHDLLRSKLPRPFKTLGLLG